MSFVEAANVWDEYDAQQVRGIGVCGEGARTFEQILDEQTPQPGFPTEI